jgi:hypothetical protein
MNALDNTASPSSSSTTSKQERLLFDFICSECGKPCNHDPGHRYLASYCCEAPVLDPDTGAEVGSV